MIRKFRMANRVMGEVKDRVFCFRDEIEGMRFEKAGKNINMLFVDTKKADPVEQVLSQYSVKFEVT